jgi:acyl carrier protein
MRTKVEDIVKSLIADQFAYPQIELTCSTHLYDDIGVDSAAMVELALRLEDIVMVEIRSVHKFETVGDLVDYVSAQIERVDHAD